MGVQIGVFLTYAGAIILVFLVGRLFLWPLRLILKFLAGGVLGGALIMLANILAAAVGAGILIPFNALNAFIIGILGLPGAVLLLILA